MNPIDALGNPIMKDDLVSIQRGDQTLVGVVLEIKEPSLLAAGKPTQMQMMGIVTVMPMPMTLPFTSEQPRFSDVLKIVKPPNFAKRES